MAIRLTSLVNQVAETEIVYFDEKGVVKYRPGAINEDMFTRAREAAEAGDELVLDRQLIELLVDWDVIDEKGEILPLTETEKDEDGELHVVPSRALRGLPIPFKASILEQISEAARGNSKTSSVSSRAGSRRRGR